MKYLLSFVLCLCTWSIFAQDSLSIYISSRNTNSIKRYQLDGAFIDDFISPNAGGLTNPQDLFFHPHENSLIVTGIENSQILRYDAQTGAFVDAFSRGYNLSRPTKMAIGPDSLLYVAQWGQTQSKIARFQLNGQFVDEFTSIGLPNGCGMAWDQDGYLYVSAFGNGSTGAVYRFDPEGNSMGVFINSSVLQGPVGVWQSGTSWLVSDWSTGQVERFDRTGQHIETFITGLSNLEGHVIDSEGRLYLCDWRENVVNRYLPDGSLDQQFINEGGLLAPNSIIFGPAPLSTNTHTPNLKPLKKTKLFPIPLNEELNMHNEAWVGHQVDIDIKDVQGRSIQYLHFKNTPSTIQISTGELQNGVYYCTILVDGRLWHSEQIIKE